jgi:hypothetical protein
MTENASSAQAFSEISSRLNNLALSFASQKGAK